MKVVDSSNRMTLPLGKSGEHLARGILFDISEYIEQYGDCEVQLIVTRPDELMPYTASIANLVNQVLWPISSYDVDKPGKGHVELKLTQGDLIVKTQTWGTEILRSIVNGSSDPTLSTPSDGLDAPIFLPRLEGHTLVWENDQGYKNPDPIDIEEIVIEACPEIVSQLGINGWVELPTIPQVSDIMEMPPEFFNRTPKDGETFNYVGTYEDSGQYKVLFVNARVDEAVMSEPDQSTEEMEVIGYKTTILNLVQIACPQGLPGPKGDIGGTFTPGFRNGVLFFTNDLGLPDPPPIDLGAMIAEEVSRRIPNP